MSDELTDAMGQVGKVLDGIMGRYRGLDEKIEALLVEREQVAFAPWPKSVIFDLVCEQIEQARIRFGADLQARLRDAVFPDPIARQGAALHARPKQLTPADLLRDTDQSAIAPVGLVSPDALLALCGDLVKAGYRQAIDGMILPTQEGLEPTARAQRLNEIDQEIDTLEEQKSELIESARRAGLRVEEIVEDAPRAGQGAQEEEAA